MTSLKPDQLALLNRRVLKRSLSSKDSVYPFVCGWCGALRPKGSSSFELLLEGGVNGNPDLWHRFCGDTCIAEHDAARQQVP